MPLFLTMQSRCSATILTGTMSIEWIWTSLHPSLSSADLKNPYFQGLILCSLHISSVYSDKSSSDQSKYLGPINSDSAFFPFLVLALFPATEFVFSSRFLWFVPFWLINFASFSSSYQYVLFSDWGVKGLIEGLVAFLFVGKMAPFFLLIGKFS